MLKLCYLFSPPTRPQTGHRIHSLSVVRHVCAVLSHGAFQCCPMLDAAVIPTQGCAFSLRFPGALPQQVGEGRPLPAPLCGQWLAGLWGRLNSWPCLPDRRPFQPISMSMQHSIIWMGLLHFRIRPLLKMQLCKGWVIPFVPLVPLVSGGGSAVGLPSQPAQALRQLLSRLPSWTRAAPVTASN